MPKDDFIHDAVLRALIKDGWTITNDPFVIIFEEIRLFADLGAEYPIGIERAERKLVVEAKSFRSLSPVHDFELALGQYLFYRVMLEETAPDRQLYLAIGEETYASFFSQKAIQLVTQKFQIAILVIDIEQEEVVQWIN